MKCVPGPLEIVRWSEMITMRPLMTSGLRHLGQDPVLVPGHFPTLISLLDAIEIKIEIEAITPITSESLLS